jgi:hypothetical protein
MQIAISKILGKRGSSSIIKIKLTLNKEQEGSERGLKGY